MTGRTTAFGLVLLASCLMMATAIASVAQAEEFTLNGSSFTSKGIASESITGSGPGGKFLVPNFGFVIACTGTTLSGTILLGGTAHATALFSGCSVEGNKFCKTYETKLKMESETEPGFILTGGLGALVTIGGEHYLLIEGSGGAPFTTIFFTKMSKGCTLPLENTKTGSFVMKAPTALTPSVAQSVETISQSELEKIFPGDILKYGNQPGWIDGGSVTLSLTGANKGQKWGAE